MKRIYGGAERGKGATYAWDGNKNVGSGRMEVLDAPPQKIVIKLDFFTPFEATTPPNSPCCRRVMAPMSPGRCMVRRTSCPS